MGRKKPKQNISSRKKICNRCGAENSSKSTQCIECNSTRFAPTWVLAKRPITRWFGAEVTETNPKFGQVEKRITLSKWWPGGRATFHIPTLKQWDSISNIIENDLAPFLGWKSKKEILQSLKKAGTRSAASKSDVKSLVQQHPEIIKQVVEAIDTSKLDNESLPELLQLAGQVADAVSGFDASFRQSFLAVVKKLPKQKKRALEELEELLGTWSLQQVTAVAQQVRQRLNTIELFKKQILDERTYEIRGENSIHRILERSMWLIDERYWLLHSNETLATFIGNEMAKMDRKRFGAKRPDFACGTIGNKLIVVELKRPSHTLKIEDLNQLETYLTLAEKYKNFTSYEGYLIGQKKDDDLMRRLRHRSSNFKVWTYSDLLEDAQKRYKDYLKDA